MTPEQVDRLLGLLERLVVATERQVPIVPATAPSSASGYTCSICHSFVAYGRLHSCRASLAVLAAGASS